MIGHNPWRRITLVLAALALAALACSLTTSSDVEDKAQDIESSPLILLLAPENGSTFAEGAQIEMYAIAQDPTAGVARLEFRMDDVPIGEITSADPAGQPSLDGTVGWIAAGQTGHLVTVEAFRSDGSPLGLSDASIKVTGLPAIQLPSGSVTTGEPASPGPEPSETAQPEQPTRTAQANPTASPVPTLTPRPPQPTPPADGPVAVVGAAIVNVRQGPGTNYPTVGMLNPGDRVVIVGRNEDSSWWAISFSGGTAWIFASLTTTEGDISQVPLVAAPPLVETD
ncbi:MAG: SH3 domain-containing protein [Anaerolineae bacterium]|nr:SH3 domain-containing protein [Anaerolineae bacterium]